MGVKGLWKLLTPIGRRISIETLEGKTLAIDLSIWVTQFIKAMRDEEGNVTKNAHLIGTLRRILKLLYHRIRPVFVFDGQSPVLKLNTIKNRIRSKDRDVENLRNAARKILVAKLKQHILNNTAAATAQNVDSTTVVQESVSVELQTSLGDDHANSLPSPDSPSLNGSKPTTRKSALYEMDSDNSDSDIDWIPEEAYACKEGEEDELNAHMLATLPVERRRIVIELTRKKERQRSREGCVSTAGKPEQYSQNQLSNFLRNSKLNEKINETEQIIARKEEVNNSIADNSIAADSGRRFILVHDQATSVNGKRGTAVSGAKVIHTSDSEEENVSLTHTQLNNETTTSTSRSIAASAVSTTPIVGSDSDDDSGGGGFMCEETDEDASAPASLYEVWSCRSCGSSNKVSYGYCNLCGESKDESREAPVLSQLESQSAITSFTAYNTTCRDSNPISRSADMLVSRVNVENVGEGEQYDDVQWETSSAGTANEEDNDTDDPCLVTRSTRKGILGSSVVTGVHSDDLTNAARHTGMFVDSAVPVKDMSSMHPTVMDDKGSPDIVDVSESSTHSESVDKSDANSVPPTDTFIARTEHQIEPHVEHVNTMESLLLSKQELVEAEAVKKQSLRNLETATSEMMEEIKDMLDMLHIPYLVAPYEAEAQCAALEAIGLVDGVITEDSDVFLFGGKTVYRNIFHEKKYVEVYRAEDAKKELGEHFVALAYLLGSDYTSGVKGVGIVNAMEIIHAFGKDYSDKCGAQVVAVNASSTEDDCVINSMLDSTLSLLSHFKQWFNKFDITEALSSQEVKTLGESGIESGTKSADEKDETLTNTRIKQFQLRHPSVRNKWIIPNSFPDVKVAKAYMVPEANYSKEKFTWDIDPTANDLKVYCKTHLHWTELMIEQQVNESFNRYFGKVDTQKRIDSYYMKYSDSLQCATIRSTRLQKVVKKITATGKDTDVPSTSVAGKSLKENANCTGTIATKKRKKRTNVVDEAAEDDQTEFAKATKCNSKKASNTSSGLDASNASNRPRTRTRGKSSIVYTE